MLAKLHRLLLDIDLPERVFKYSQIVSLSPRVRYWGAYTIHMYTYIHIYIYIV